MSEASKQVRLMTAADIGTVACLHRVCFPHSRSSMLGLPFTRAMYRWFLSNQGQLATVCETEGEIAGFMTGAIGGYGRRLFRATWPQILYGLATHPWLWIDPKVFKLWHSYLKGFLPMRYRVKPQAQPGQQGIKASVAGIAVTPNFRGRGIAQLLLHDFENRAIRLGATNLSLSVLTDNAAAQKSYEKAGWRLVNTDAYNSSYYVKQIGELNL